MCTEKNVFYHRNPAAAVSNPAWKRKKNFNNSRSKKNPIPRLNGVKDLKTYAESLRKHPAILTYDLSAFNRGKGKLNFVEVTEGKTKNRTHIIFFDKKFVEENVTSDHWYIDSTFRVRPKRCGYQLMTIMAKKKQKSEIVNWLWSDWNQTIWKILVPKFF